jgi:hypothetical protein
MSNPITRLHTVVKELSKYQNEPFGRAVANILQMPASTPRDAINAFSSFVDMTTESLDFVKENGDFDKTHYLSLLTKLDTVIVSMHPNAPASQIFQNLLPTDLTILELATHSFSFLKVEKPIKKEELDSWLDQIGSFIENISNNIQDTSLKSILISCLEIMKESIFQYKIRGAKRIQKNSENLIIQLVRARTLIQNEDESGKNIIRNLWDFASKLDTSISLSINTQTLINTLPAVADIVSRVLNK